MKVIMREWILGFAVLFLGDFHQTTGSKAVCKALAGSEG